MKFCENCGNKLEEGMAFCPECGIQVPEQNTWEESEPMTFTEREQQSYEAKEYSFADGKGEVEGHKLFAALSYLGILVLVPLLMDSNSEYSRFHANQGLVLTIALVLVHGASFVAGVLSSILLSLFCGIANIVLCVVGIMGIVHAMTGQKKELPIVGKFRILQ